ncbi:MAG: hypothetical protein Kow0042_12290 [Calditrichia bacterium]
MRQRKIILSLGVLLVLLSILFAQEKERTLFQQGIDYYQNGKYAEAQNRFLQLLKTYPETPLLTATKLMLAKSYYKQGDYRAALIVSDNFIRIHKTSAYLDDIHFLKGKIYYRQGKYIEAIEEWKWVVNNPGDTRLKNRAGEFIFQTMATRLSGKEIDELEEKYQDDTFSGLVEIVKAQKLIRSGKRREGIQRIENFIEKNPYHIYAQTARQILQMEMGGEITTNSILILKSLQPETQPIMDEMTQGILYAAHEMRMRNPEKLIEVDTLTYQPGVLPLLQNTFSFLNKKQPLAMIGPVDNDETAALVLLSRYENFPFIIPLSSQNGMGSLSPYSFQMNPDAEIKGEFLGEYATRELNLKTFAVLAPANAYGQDIVRSFEETITTNGGELVEKQWYYEGTQDFSRQLKSIRKKGFYIAFRDSVLETNSTLSEPEIKAQFEQYKTEVLFSDETIRGDIDSTQIPSTGIDGLFLAIYPEDIPYIAPQFAFHNIQCTLLGNEGWNDPEQLIRHRPYLDGLIYVTAGYYDPKSWNYIEFMNRFRQQMHTTPQFYHLLGYDIGKWMFSHYTPGMSRIEFRNKLANTDRYTGIVENIHFGKKERVNSELNIIRFYLGQFLKLK